MISLTTRSPVRAASQKVLRRRVAYLEDRQHESHRDKIIYPARNYNCFGDDGEDFVQACIRTDDAYQAARLGRPGKPSKSLFNELIYSSDLGAHLTDLERESIELLTINEFARNTPCRTAWHTNASTGRADLHILAAAKDDDYPPRVSLWRSFGGSKGRHLYHTMDLVDARIAKQLNKVRPKEKKIRSARKAHKQRIQTLTGKVKADLAKELAPLGLAMSELRKGIEKLGYKVLKETAKNISVLFAGAKRPSRYNKVDLIKKIAEIPLGGKSKAHEGLGF
jgi:hypothetical protein